MAEDDESWKDTNVGAIGSDEDKALRKAAADTEAAWSGVGEEPGIKIWRIEHFNAVEVDASSYGKFHKGDSYLVLQTVSDPDSGSLHRTIYFYLGSETSIDERGTAAYKTVELDDYFGGEPKEVREEMGQESQAFKELFGGELEYLEGGIDSGFKHVVPEGYDPKLFVVRRVKGKTKVVQAPLKKNIVNENDCFVLDAADKIYVYDGKNASPFEKSAANTKAEQIEAARASDASATHDVDDGFWALLGA
eukprot:TRINITY_DN113_c0_g1_i1.p1 TRINITY_DN113_c0_g1~~TRINITY_DN113_c0_g1_i1.p1  ORF type:complete len:249 (-),score=68.52 TRINITY_DN113_c0_g1_i1:676-1422(-)